MHRPATPRFRWYPTLLAVLLLHAACSASGGVVAPSTSSDPPPIANPQPEAPVPTAPEHPAGHEETAPDPPVGPLPSFNESPGCGGPDGIRGPYADAEGAVPDGQVLGGPWGDFFGRTMGDIRDRLVAMRLPNGDDRAPVTVYVHERVAPALAAVIENLERELAAGRSYPLDPGSVFSFRPATIPPKRYLSFHAIGAAIDINADANPYSEENVLTTDLPDWFVQAWVEAGWCWGGDWQEIKDPMHFSWMGPLHTPGYPLPDPFPPLTPPSDFTLSVTFGTGLGPAKEGSVLLVTDMDRDGAPDAVRIESPAGSAGRMVRTAQAIHRFDTCTTAGPTPHTIDPASQLAFADRTGDARPDLWEFLETGDGLTITVFTFASGYTRHLSPLVVADVPGNGALLVGDYDLDGSADLWVVRSGRSTTLEVRFGPDFATSMRRSLPIDADPEWRYGLGRRDGDWTPDLFALAPTGELTVLMGADRFRTAEVFDTGAAAHSGTLQPDDLDGDGWDDLLFFDRDGTVTAYLGGEPSGAAELGSWFLEGGDLPWEYRAGCPGEPLPFR